MPSFFASNINFGVDLRSAAPKQVQFLKQVYAERWLHNAEVLKVAVYRYEKFWLPLLRKNFNENLDLEDTLIPPIDVDWVWHVHMLSPTSYKKDCSRYFGRLIDHRMTTRDDGTCEKVATTKKIWAQNFPDEPFDLPKSREEVVQIFEEILNGFESKLELDIVGSALRQESFYYQVSLPHYQKWFFLTEAFTRYKKFLHLKKLHRKELLVPCYDIDLMWHTHQLHPSYYISDCMKILNMVLPHDDSVSDRSEGSVLSAAFARTKELWLETFKENYEKPGAMYRGEDPRGKLSAVGAGCDLVKVQIDAFEIESLTVPKILWRKDQPATIAVQLLTTSNGRTVIQNLFKAEWLIGPKSHNFQLKSFNNSKILVRSDAKTSLMIEIVANKSRFASLMPKKIAATPYPGVQIQSSGNHGRQLHDVPLEVYWDEDPKSAVAIHVDFKHVATSYETSKMSTNLCVERGSFYETTMPENAASLWGPVPMDKLPVGEDNVCHAVSHK